MKYGLENNILLSPYSFLVSIVLVFGISLIGDFIQKFYLKNLEKFTINNYNICYSPILGTFSLITFLYPFLIFEFFVKKIFFLSAYSLFILGVFNIYTKIRIILNQLKKIFIKKEKNILIIFALFISLFLISATPITHADALDYHISGALNLIHDGSFYKELLPMHNNLVSLGEIILAVGFVLGAEQFGAMIQFTSLLALIPFFLRKKARYIFLISILICPITFFLVSSPKPQLLNSVASFLIFIFLFENFKKLSNRDSKKIFLVVVLILILNYLTKYSFIVSSALLYIYSLYVMNTKQLLKYSLFSSFLLAFFIIIPFYIFRYINFETQISDIIFNPLPVNLEIYEKFNNFLTSGSVSFLNFFFPKNIGAITTTYGPILFGLLLFFVDKRIHKNMFPLIIIIIFLSIVFLFGGKLNRLFYEGFLWITYFASLFSKQHSYKIKIFNNIIIIQTIFILFIYIFFIFNILPGSFNNNYRIKVMNENANGFKLANWANEYLDNEDIILTTHRSISLYNAKTYSTDFLSFIDFSKDNSKKIIEFLKKKEINKIIFHGKKLNKGVFEMCLGKKLAYKKNVGNWSGRNPFNDGPSYDGWIYEFNHYNLPECIKKFN